MRSMAVTLKPRRLLRRSKAHMHAISPLAPASSQKASGMRCDAIDILCCHPPVYCMHYCTTPQHLAREPTATCKPTLFAGTIPYLGTKETFKSGCSEVSKDAHLMSAGTCQVEPTASSCTSIQMKLRRWMSAWRLLQGKAVYLGGPDRQLKPLSDNNTVLVPEAHRHRLCLQR